MEKYTITILGNADIGKTSLANYYVRGYSSENVSSTIGFCFHNKIISRGCKQIRLEIRDTAGSERFRSVVKQQLRNLDGVILAFSLNDEKSLKDVSYWKNEVKKMNDDGKVSFVIAATKCDLETLAESFNKGAQLANELNTSLVQVSSKTGEGVERVFDTLIDRIMQNKSGPSLPVNTISHSYIIIQNSDYPIDFYDPNEISNRRNAQRKRFRC